MKYGINDSLLIAKWAPALNGVFTVFDLKNLLNETNSVVFYRRINTLIQTGILRQFTRGIFITSDFNKETLAMKINEKSYISLGSALSKALLIGSIPEKRLYTIKIGRNRTYKDDSFTITCLGITPVLFFGYKSVEGVNIALPEKAFLDTLYFYTKGQNYSFDIFSDIDVHSLDKKLILKWLNEYKNKRFRTFVKGYLNERS
jgi:hypothetical protein